MCFNSKNGSASSSNSLSRLWEGRAIVFFSFLFPPFFFFFYFFFLFLILFCSSFNFFFFILRLKIYLRFATRQPKKCTPWFSPRNFSSLSLSRSRFLLFILFLCSLFPSSLSLSLSLSFSFVPLVLETLTRSLSLASFCYLSAVSWHIVGTYGVGRSAIKRATVKKKKKKKTTGKTRNFDSSAEKDVRVSLKI